MTQELTYQQVFDEGYADGKIITSPIKTNGHTESAYLSIQSKYLSCIHDLFPTEWQRGYGLGLDKAAEEAGFTNDAEVGY